MINTQDSKADTRQETSEPREEVKDTANAPVTDAEKATATEANV